LCVRRVVAVHVMLQCDDSVFAGAVR